MSELIAITFPDKEQAEYARMAVLELKRDYLLELGDVVIAEMDQNGKVKLHQSVHLVGAGAIEGGFLGTLVGLIFLSPLFGLAIGATVGAVGGWLADFGIDDEYMKQLAEQVEPGSAVLFMLVDEVPREKALDRLHGIGGTVLRTSLDTADERKLREALEDLRRPADSERAEVAGRVGGGKA